jgi:hypothetical protein
MGIQNFPASLQPIIQQGFLEREFSQALRSKLGYSEPQVSWDKDNHNGERSRRHPER